jgi:hypothetical protein
MEKTQCLLFFVGFFVKWVLMHEACWPCSFLLDASGCSHLQVHAGKLPSE